MGKIRRLKRQLRSDAQGSEFHGGIRLGGTAADKVGHGLLFGTDISTGQLGLIELFDLCFATGQLLVNRQGNLYGNDDNPGRVAAMDAARDK